MTNRPTPLLARLARILLLGTIVAPLLFAVAQVIPGGPRVQWMAGNAFTGPVMRVAMENRFDPPWGFTVFVTNAGNTESEEVRIVLGAGEPFPPARPSNVDVLDLPSTDYEIVHTEEGVTIRLRSLEPAETVRVVLYRVSTLDLREVLHGGEPVEATEAPPRFDSRLRLPRWTVLGALFLIAGLAVQVVALRGQAARNGVA